MQPGGAGHRFLWPAGDPRIDGSATIEEMRVALDATYSIDPHPSGIAIYSRQMLRGLAATYPADEFVHCYRPKQFLRSTRSDQPNVSRQVLFSGSGLFSADIFHALNQRVDRRKARKVVSTFHDLFVMTGEYSSPDFRRRFTQQARNAAERSDLIIAVSEFTAGQITSLLKVEPSRIRVVPHGVAAPEHAPHSQKQKIILFVGALQLRKNVRRLVEAFEEVPEPWRLVLAGAPSGYQADEILERIERSPCRARIEITGYVPRQRLDELFGEASIFAFPSLDEGFGIPVLEAMAWGVPVITSDGSALAQLARGAALLVDPNNVDELAGALKVLAEDKVLRERLAAAGKSRSEDFTWGAAVEKTWAVYAELG